MAAKRTTLLFKVVLLLFHIDALLTLEIKPLSSKSELSALFRLRGSLGLRAKDWPRKADPCLNWTGVYCQDGRVTGINLSGLRRTNVGRSNPRFAVDSLGNFSQLVSFNSSRFQLLGAIPDWFGQKLQALQVLDLRSCSINGSIPPSLGNLSRLHSLLLAHNSITGTIPPTLGQLLSLSVLNLSQNLLNGSIPSTVSSLRNLASLDLSSNSLSGTISSKLGAPFTQLQYVDLSSNGFYGYLPNTLLSMPQLRFLDLSSNNLTGEFPDLTSTALNVTGAVLNFSNNQFYKRLSLPDWKSSSIDLSSNYFEGFPPKNSSSIAIMRNCFRNVPDQRRLEECRMFYAGRGLVFDSDSVPDLPQPPKSEPMKKRNRLTYIMVGVFGSFGFVVILVFVLVLLLKTCGQKNLNQAETSNTVPVPEGGKSPPPKVFFNLSGLGESFTYGQMLEATNDFSDANLIKKGHSGDLFRGTMEGGSPVVIKRVNLHSTMTELYMSELELFRKVTHTRLVPLLGHCLEHENEKLVVYKYMPNGDLSNSLYRFTNLEDDSLQSLDWITRLKIAIGAAEGLSYLHHECNPPLVHRDIQASSILLDDKYEVRLGSLSKVCGQEGDNQQNVFTRLLRKPQSSEQILSGSSSSPNCAYDVYCFGKVLLELVTGKLGISKLDNDPHTKEWLEHNLPFISIYDKENVSMIVDQSMIIDEDLLEEVWAVAIVAKSCLNPKPSRRPLMRQILRALENPFKIVREESFNSARLRTTSSRRSWSAAFFGSWRHSSSEGLNFPGQTIRESTSGLKLSGRVSSQGSGTNDHSSLHKRMSSEIFPEPLEVLDLEKQNEN